MLIDNRLLQDLLFLVEKWDRMGRCLEADKQRYRFTPELLCAGDAEHSSKTYKEASVALSKVLAQYYVRQNVAPANCPRSICGTLRRQMLNMEMSY